MFWEPGARCSSGGRADYSSVCGSHLDLGSLRPRGKDEIIETTCGWTLLGVVWKAFRSREIFGVGGPFLKKAPTMPNPRKDATPSKPSNPRREETELPPGFGKLKPGESPLLRTYHASSTLRRGISPEIAPISDEYMHHLTLRGPALPGVGGH